MFGNSKLYRGLALETLRLARSASLPSKGHRRAAGLAMGYLVTDAYLAALTIEHGCELITTDSDFACFQGLRWRHPLGA
jgi:predicted nucleic acid-binding protein